MSETYSDIFQSYDIASEAIPEKNRIWRIQNPYLYKYPISTRMKDVVMIRKNFCNMFPGYHIVDGYSYYRANVSKYQCWFPTIYQSHFSRNSIPSIGYYIRDCRRQSNLAFIDFVGKLHSDIPIVTMGDLGELKIQLSRFKNWQHTQDNDVFWKGCSHYFYYRCSDFEDPFPQSLLEAIQSQHRIISPKNPNRTFIDGIDDFLSCIEYDEEFVESNEGKHCQALDSSTWNSHIHCLVEEKFKRQSIIYKGLLYDWIAKKLR